MLMLCREIKNKIYNKILKSKEYKQLDNVTVLDKNNKKILK